jgi:hypothetical protein
MPALACLYAITLRVVYGQLSVAPRRKSLTLRSRISWRLCKIEHRGAMKRRPGQSKIMTIDTGEAAIRTVFAAALAECAGINGRAVDALFAMREAEVVVKALEHRV